MHVCACVCVCVCVCVSQALDALLKENKRDFGRDLIPDAIRQGMKVRCVCVCVGVWVCVDAHLCVCAPFAPSHTCAILSAVWFHVCVCVCTCVFLQVMAYNHTGYWADIGECHTLCIHCLVVTHCHARQHHSQACVFTAHRGAATVSVQHVCSVRDYNRVDGVYRCSVCHVRVIPCVSTA